MTQPPATVTYSLEEIFGQISQKLDRIDQKVDNFRIDVDRKFEEFRKDVDAKFEKLQNHVDAKFEKLETSVVDLKVGQSRLEAEVKAIGKRLDTQEFINRSVVVGFILALVVGAVRLFLPNAFS